ncbi:MAG: SDR family oxidoreductase [Rhizobiales bacterium]|nr:SDR family oxidoreductase [Hyphomicrobiales bacterium]
MSSLEGKTILVTGASKGIGSAITRTLGFNGASVIAHFGGDLQGAKDAICDFADGTAITIGADLSDMSAVDTLWREALDWRGRIDVVVNNAAVMRLCGGIADSDEAWDDVWAEAVDVNILAPARLMRHAVRHYLESGGGTLITISSWAAQRGITNPEGIAYSATKSAVMAATKTIARGYAKDNILAYIVAPGVVRTRLSEESAATLGGEEVVTAGLAMGEWVPPEELADLVAFLSTGKCRHLSGATLDVNGASYVR